MYTMFSTIFYSQSIFVIEFFNPIINLNSTGQFTSFISLNVDLLSCFYRNWFLKYIHKSFKDIKYFIWFDTFYVRILISLYIVFATDLYFCNKKQSKTKYTGSSAPLHISRLSWVTQVYAESRYFCILWIVKHLVKFILSLTDFWTVR